MRIFRHYSVSRENRLRHDLAASNSFPLRRGATLYVLYLLTKYTLSLKLKGSFRIK